MDDAHPSRPSPTGHTAGAQETAGAHEAVQVIAALATTERLQVFAAVVLGAQRPSVIAEQAGVSEARAVSALARLQKAGLVVASTQGFTALASTFADLARRQATPRPTVDYGTDDPVVVAVLNAFLADGRITSMPAQRAKRRTLLQHIVTVFEPGARYTEAQVNAILASFYADTATLRRYLVDEQLLDRSAGLSWRIGGWVDVLD